MKQDKHPFDVDLGHLEEEWANFPREYYKVAIDLAEARKDLDHAKRDKEVVVAELDKAIRTAPEQFDLTEKLTEKAIENAIKLQRRYVLADTAAIGQVDAATAITAANTGTASDTISIEMAASGTVFTAGAGYFVIKIQNMDTADALAAIAARLGDLGLVTP